MKGKGPVPPPEAKGHQALAKQPLEVSTEKTVEPQET